MGESKKRRVKMTGQIVVTVEIEFDSYSAEDTKLCREQIEQNVEVVAQSFIPLYDEEGEECEMPECVGIHITDTTWRKVKVRRTIEKAREAGK